MKWKLAAVSVTGPSHLDDNDPCEDAFFVDQTSNGFAIGIVSDGAGSARFGGRAATLICESFHGLHQQLAGLEIAEGPEPLTVETVEQIWAAVSGLLDRSCDDARAGLLEAARAEEAEPADFLATLIGAIAHPSLGAIIFHIGDGAVTAFNADGEAIRTSQPENGEYLNQTYFLVEEYWKEHLRGFRVDEPLREIFIMTDGVTDLAYVRTARVLAPEARFFRPLSAFLDAHERDVGEKALARSLDGEDARQRVDDDKTIGWMKLLDVATTG